MTEQATQLREGAEALRSWMNSMVEQRNGWNYPQGVEANSRDALEAVFRVANTVVNTLPLIADALDKDKTNET